MGDAAPNRASKDDDDNKSNTEENLNGDESSERANNVELSENVATVTIVDIPEVSPTTAEESRTSDGSGPTFLRRMSDGTYFTRRRRKPVFLTFRARHRPRQPFMAQMQQQQAASHPPRPPAYYTAQVTADQHRPDLIRATSESSNSHQRLRRGGEEVQTTQPRSSNHGEDVTLRPRQPQGGIGILSNPFFFNYAYWSPYPDNVPRSVLPCLAHLYQVDSLFIIQQINVLDMMFLNYFDVPNFYLIQNKEGKVIYYVYETTNICLNCCGDSRGFQLHVMDMYNNEVIYMNRPCGCTNFACCYPLMEIYSPPLVPVGAVMQVYNSSKHEFAVIDADENLIFKIYGPLCFNICCCSPEVDFTIHALDKQETEIGIIRREWGGFVMTYIAESDMYGITFPKDLDVRIKAVFLGALFFIEYLYFEDY